MIDNGEDNDPGSTVLKFTLEQWKLVLRVASAWCIFLDLSTDHAEDISVDAALKASRWAEENKVAPTDGLLYTITKNKAKDHKRRSGRKKDPPLLDLKEKANGETDLPPIPDQRLDPEKELLLCEKKQALCEHFEECFQNELNDEQRQALRLRYARRSYKDIARIMGRPKDPSWVKDNLLLAAKRKLTACMSKYLEANDIACDDGLLKSLLDEDLFSHEKEK